MWFVLNSKSSKQSPSGVDLKGILGEKLGIQN